VAERLAALIMRGLASSLFVAVCFGAGVLGHWVSERELPTHVLEARNFNGPVRVGETLHVTMSVLREEACAFNVDRIITDSSGTVFTLPDLNYNAPLGPMGHVKVDSLVPMPTNVAPGHAIYRMMFAYRCNPTHWIWPVTSVVDIPFEIIP
jgi:hypothetical protein